MWSFRSFTEISTPCNGCHLGCFAWLCIRILCSSTATGTDVYLRNVTKNEIISSNVCLVMTKLKQLTHLALNNNQTNKDYLRYLKKKKKKMS